MTPLNRPAIDSTLSRFRWLIGLSIGNVRHAGRGCRYRRRAWAPRMGEVKCTFYNETETVLPVKGPPLLTLRPSSEEPQTAQEAGVSVSHAVSGCQGSPQNFFLSIFFARHGALASDPWPAPSTRCLCLHQSRTPIENSLSII